MRPGEVRHARCGEVFDPKKLRNNRCPGCGVDITELLPKPEETAPETVEPPTVIQVDKLESHQCPHCYALNQRSEKCSVCGQLVDVILLS